MLQTSRGAQQERQERSCARYPTPLCFPEKRFRIPEERFGIPEGLLLFRKIHVATGRFKWLQRRTVACSQPPTTADAPQSTGKPRKSHYNAPTDQMRRAAKFRNATPGDHLVPEGFFSEERRADSASRTQRNTWWNIFSRTNLKSICREEAGRTDRIPNEQIG